MPKRKGNFVEEMSQDIKLECRINCNVTDTEQPFPEDDFILADVQVKSEPVKEEPFVLERCTEHGKELIMFCKGEGCKKQICVSCLIGDHRPHDVVEIEKLEVDFLQNKRLIQRNLEIIIRETQTVEEKIEVKTGNFVAEVNAQRDDMNRRFDKMIKDAEDEAATPSTTVSVMQEYLETLKRLNSGDVGNYDMMLNNLENVKGIGNHMKEHLSGNKTYRFYEFIGGQAVKKEISADLSELRWAEAENKESIVTEPSSTGSRTITHASQLNCQVVRYCVPSCIYGAILRVMSDGTMGVFGYEDGQWRLKRFDQQGTELSCAELKGELSGLAEVTLGGEMVLAASYPIEQQIEFRDVNELKTVILAHKMAPHQPYRLSTSSPSTLLYVNRSKEPREVRVVDCSGTKPKAVEGKNVIRTKQASISDMCAVQDGERQLLVVTDSGKHGGVYAYNTATDVLEWSVKGKLEGMDEEMDAQGVTTDGRGDLFVCDPKNECIQMFRVRDGAYMGAVMRQEEQELKYPRQIQWCETTSSLVVAHRMACGGSWFISIIRVE